MSFSSDVEKWSKATNTSIDKTIRAVCLAVTKEVVERTPVELGRLRGNWFATIGAPSAAVTETVDKDGRATIARAQPAIDKAPGKQWWLTNNLPYAMRIEFEGWSKIKAPAGMVRITAENVRANVREAAQQNEPRL